VAVPPGSFAPGFRSGCWSGCAFLDLSGLEGHSHPDSDLAAGVTARQGKTDAELLAAYPSLNAEELANAWNYARTHREEMDREIAANGDESWIARLYSNGNFPPSWQKPHQTWKESSRLRRNR